MPDMTEEARLYRNAKRRKEYAENYLGLRDRLQKKARERHEALKADPVAYAEYRARNRIAVKKSYQKHREERIAYAREYQRQHPRRKANYTPEEWEKRMGKYHKANIPPEEWAKKMEHQRQVYRERIERERKEIET